MFRSLSTTKSNRPRTTESIWLRFRWCYSVSFGCFVTRVTSWLLFEIHVGCNRYKPVPKYRDTFITKFNCGKNPRNVVSNVLKILLNLNTCHPKSKIKRLLIRWTFSYVALRISSLTNYTLMKLHFVLLYCPLHLLGFFLFFFILYIPLTIQIRLADFREFLEY